jgi:hypothetical protein
MAENPFDPKNFGLLAALGAGPRRNSLLDYIAPPTPMPEISPLARTIANLLMDGPKPAPPFGGAANDLFSSPPPASPKYSFGNLGAVADLFPSAKAELPVDPYRYSNALTDFLGPPKPAPTNALSGAVAALFPTSPLSNPFGFLGSFIAPPAPSSFPPPPTSTFGSLTGLLSPPSPSPLNALYAPPPKPKAVEPETKRKAFFSFYFEDVMRVNNVRQAWKITHPDSADNRSFYDSSLWESRKITNEEALKRLIRAGVLYTSAVCVLAGSETWERRWVRYEIARAIIDGRGLLTVHLNGLNHHRTRAPHPRGHNPLAVMAIGRHQPDAHRPPLFYLYEKKPVSDGRGGWEFGWVRYADHTSPIKLPRWVDEPSLHNYVMPLSVNAAEYDYVADHGHRNVGSWIDKAAKQAGR